MAVYLVTGASSGIGEQVARQAVARGHEVYGVARRGELLGALAAALGGAFTPLVADVADKEAVRALCAGLPRLPDVAVLNAAMGVMDSRKAFDVSLHERTMAVNYFGALRFVEALLPAFRDRGSGVFAVTSSLAGYRGLPKSIAYAASKAALSSAVESLRLTYGRDGKVRFVTIHPGFVDTPMTKSNTFSMPFLWTPERAARRILDGIEKGKVDITFPLPMRLLMNTTRLLPAGLYAKIMGMAKV